MAPAAALTEPLVVGASHRSATAALRDRLYLEPASVPAFLQRMRGAGLAPGMVLSTCDRTELALIDDGQAGLADRAIDLLAEQAGVATAEVTAQAYRLRGDPALQHLFAVAGSLDSPVIGEPQILGQLKLAHRQAAEAGLVEGSLSAVLQAAYVAAKRIRSETTIAERPVSMAAAAVQLARNVHGDLSRCGALLLGSGEMGELMVEQLRRAGLARLTVAHPVPRRAELLAQRLVAHHAAMAGLADVLAAADIVVGALGAGTYAIVPGAIAAALKTRRRRPMLLIDAAIPGDLDPMIDALADVFRYDLADLEQIAVQGQAERAAAAARGWAIVAEEVARFRREQAARDAVPTVVALRRHFETMRAEILAQGPSDDAATATRRLINRLLHDPSELLRRAAAGGGEMTMKAAALEQALRQMFRLADGEATDEEEIG
jgi:glutamyl-tRNA reductase